MKKNTPAHYIISRNFVEFGAFTAVEIASFRQRSVLVDHDYVRSVNSHDWLPLGTWMAEAAPVITETKPVAKAAPRKRSTPAAKSAKKAA
ncbi:MAG: hypothetical protein K8R87_03880 [Verrucomicrobia bacterium]|nr:hypothetical protein [Verrucomicrobiota bacterium]